MNDNYAKLAAHLKTARRMLIFTGAGISTASGIPDFRGPQGVWTRRKPVYYQDFMTSEAARIEHWNYKQEGWAAMTGARPNAVHHAIVKLEKSARVILVVTQNIDGLHTRAGTSLSVWSSFTAQIRLWSVRAVAGAAIPSRTWISFA